MTEFHILLAGIEIGPLTERQVRAYLHDGLVSPSDPARMDRMTEWETIESLLAKIPQPVPVTPRLYIPEIVPPENDGEASNHTASQPLPEPLTGPLPESTPEPEPSSPAEEPLRTPTSPLIEYAARAQAQKAKRAKSSKIVMQPIVPLTQDRESSDAAPPISPAFQREATPGETGSLPVFAIPPPSEKKPKPIKDILAGRQPSSDIPPAKKRPEPKPLPPPLPELPRPKKKRPARSPLHYDRKVLLYLFGGLSVIVILSLCALFFSGTSAPKTADIPSPTNAPPTTPAINPIQALLTSQPKTAGEFTERGFARYNVGQTDNAVADYNQAIQLDPNFTLAYYRRGLARQHVGDWNNALIDFNQVLRLDPRNALAFTSRAFVKQSQGDLDGAIADYTQAILIDPSIPLAYYNRGIIKKTRGDRDGAILDFNHVIDQATGTPPTTVAKAYLSRGEVKYQSGNQDGAIADYTHAIQLNPNNFAAYYSRGAARQDQGDLDGAYADYSKAIDLNPRLADAYFQRGMIREQRNDLDGAIDDNSRVLDLDAQNPQPYCNRGLAYMGKGHLDQALSDLKRFCSLVPHSSDTDYAQLYIWLISTEENPEGDANSSLLAALNGDWNSPPGDLASKLAKFLLDRMTEKDILAEIDNADPLKQSLVRCKVSYFAGMKRLFNGDQTTAVEYFRTAVATERQDSPEYIFALNRLRAMGQSARSPGPEPR